MGFYPRHREEHKLDHDTSLQRLSNQEGLSEDRLKKTNNQTERKKVSNNPINKKQTKADRFRVNGV